MNWLKIIAAFLPGSGLGSSITASIIASMNERGENEECIRTIEGLDSGFRCYLWRFSDGRTIDSFRYEDEPSIKVLRSLKLLETLTNDDETGGVFHRISPVALRVLNSKRLQLLRDKDLAERT